MSLFNDSTRSGSQPGYKTMSVGVRRLQEALNMHMDVQSKSQFVEALNQYHVSRDVPTFVRNLKQVLDTPAKKQLFGLIRKVIPKMDIEEFDRCVQFHGKKFDTMPAKRSKKPIQRSRSPLPGGGFNTIQPFKKQQKQKKVKESRRGKESDGKESDSSRSTKHTMTSKSSRSLKSAMKNKGPDIKKVHMKQSDDPQKGFGFSIRGGSEFGLGIYVSIVDKGGVAEKHGLNTGDLIMEANGVSCEKISHNEAAAIIRSAKKLDLKLSQVGRIPGTFVVHQMYKWVDAHSRPVSPPPELEQLGQVDSLGRRSGFSLLKGADERKINVNVQRGQGLGLMIRGGREFGLGIYISGVDPFSVADDNGIKVGDQILDINGQSFLDITHAEAVKVLKYSTQMIMTIKDVGKLPYGRTKIDETHWVNNSAPPLRRKRNDSQKSDSTVTSSKGSVFRKGMGSQLMLNSTIYSKWDSIQNQASELLNETEQGTLRYYLSEYQRGYISVDGLLMASFELLNTKAKMTMMSEIKKWVRARDINKFNVLLQRREAQQNKLFRSSSVSLDGGRHGGFTRHRHRLSEGALQSLPPSRSHSARERPGRLRRQASESELEPLRWAIEQIEGDPNFNSDLNDDLEPFQSLRLRSLSSESLSAPPNLHQTSLSSRRSLSVETLTPVYIDTTSDLPPSPRQRDDLEPFQSLRLRSLSSESLSAPPNLHQTSLSSRRSLSVETLTPVYIDTTSDLPPSPRQRVNSSSSMQQRSRANSASQKHRPREAYSHRQRSGSNSSTLRKRHKSLENLTTSRSPSPTFRRVKSPYPSRRNSHDDVRNTLSSVSYTHLQDFESEYDDSPVISRSPRLNQISNIVYADVHQPPRNVDGNPSDDSGVEVNGNHGNGQNRVTISADHPVDIDDVLERRTPFLPSSVSAPQSRNASITNRKNHYRSNNSTLTNQKPSTKPRRSVQNVFDNQNRLKLNGNGSVSSIRSDRKRPPVEIRINDGEGSIETMSIETPSSPHFVNQSRNSFVHQSYARSKRSNQSGLRHRRSHASRYSDTDDDGNDDDDDDDEPEMFDAHSEMGDNSDFYVSPLDRVLDREDYDAYSDRSSVISYNFEDQSVSLARQKYGDIPLEFIQVYKTKPTLGMAIEGGANTRQPLPRVINLQPGGSAYESGGLKVGHVILEVNGRPMRGLEHIAAAKVIAEAFKNKTRDIMELLVTDSSVK